MKFILFCPFNMEKWFIMGFAAWIAKVGAGGGGGSGGGFSSPGDASLAEQFSGFSEFWDQYGTIIITVGLGITLVILTIGTALMWLHARGKFIFLENVLQNRASIVEPWKRYKKQGNSLFLWNLGIGAAGLIFFLICTAIFIPEFNALRQDEMLTEFAAYRILFVIMLIVIYSGCVSFLQMLVNDFVMLIMAKRNVAVLEAWRYLLPLFKSAFGKFLIYSLVRFVVAILTGLAVLLACLCTCCVLLLALAIPYIGTVCMLPVYIFNRLISVEFIRQFGVDLYENDPAEGMFID